MKRYGWKYEKTWHGGCHRMVESEHGYWMLASDVLPELDRLNARIAELESAQRWHDASEPPTEEGEYEVIQYADTPTRRFAFWRNGEWRNQHEQTLGGITHYKRAAPMPGKGAEG